MMFGFTTIGAFASLLVLLSLTSSTLQNMTHGPPEVINTEPLYVLKCCEMDENYNETNRCVKKHDGVDGRFPIPKQVYNNGTVEAYKTDQFILIYRKLDCIKSYIMIPSDNVMDEFGISKKGWLLNQTGHDLSQPETFCLEKMQDSFEIFTIVCYNTENDGLNLLYTIALIVSLPFLFCTFLVYALIKELRNLHGKSVMCHVATLLVAFTGLLITQFETRNIEGDLVCLILAYIIQFSFLASFFWLNVMCFDLWWTFSGFRSLEEDLNQHKSKSFMIYSFYAWGCPSVITTVTFCMHNESLSDQLHLPNPHFGSDKCWFDDGNYSLTLYFYGPISFLVFCNLLMFIHTGVIIIRQMKNRLKLKDSESKINSKHDTQRFILYLKLFIVMGVNWLAEIISWYFKDYFQESVWYFTDTANALKGVLIFFIVVCKKRVLKMLKKKFCLQFECFKTFTTPPPTKTESDISY